MANSSPFKNPPLMVIGDSLAQGCRSLSVTRKLCAESYPAIIADEQGWDFNVPAFPRPVLFDLEALIRRYVNWLGLLKWPLAVAGLESNFTDWKRHFAQGAADGPEWCDNLAVAGAELQDLERFTWQRTRDLLASYSNRSLLDLALHEKGAAADIHLGINSGYVLNPGGKPKYANWTALDWVRERKPRRLIVHAGHNDGLYPIGSNAIFTDLLKTTLPKYLRMIEQVAAVTDISQEVIFILLPKVSAVANLDVEGKERTSSGYFREYTPWFSMSGDTFDALEMERIDLMIKEVNTKIRAKLDEYRDSHWFEVVEAYSILKENDYKHTRSREQQTGIGEYLIDNRYLAGRSVSLSGPPGHGGGSGAVTTRTLFKHGGFQSIDGMHPSAVGYGEVAAAFMRMRGWSYNVQRIRRNALRAEKLITDYPDGLTSVIKLMHARRSRPTADGIPDVPLEGNNESEFRHVVLAAQNCVLG